MESLHQLKLSILPIDRDLRLDLSCFPRLRCFSLRASVWHKGTKSVELASVPHSIQQIHLVFYSFLGVVEAHFPLEELPHLTTLRLTGLSNVQRYISSLPGSPVRCLVVSSLQASWMPFLRELEELTVEQQYALEVKGLPQLRELILLDVGSQATLAALPSLLSL